MMVKSWRGAGDGGGEWWGAGCTCERDQACPLAISRGFGLEFGSGSVRDGMNMVSSPFLDVIHKDAPKGGERWKQ